VKQLQDDRVVAYNSMFLGVFMSLFGFLKFFEPFRTMFAVQIDKSGLPAVSIPFGKVAEIAIGLGLIVPARFRHEIDSRYGPAIFAASTGLVVNMGVATYVHMQPDVPASVLPLGIKTPFIPLFVMVLAILNLCRVILVPRPAS